MIQHQISFVGFFLDFSLEITIDVSFSFFFYLSRSSLPSTFAIFFSLMICNSSNNSLNFLPFIFFKTLL